MDKQNQIYETYTTCFFSWKLVFLSCKKENQTTADTQLYGQWKWESYHSGSPTNTLTPQNTGIQETLIFKSDQSWTKIQNNVTVSSGIYTTAISKKSDGENINSLSYNNTKNHTDTTQYYKVYNDTTLIFSNDFTGTTGSASRVYVRSK